MKNLTIVMALLLTGCTYTGITSGGMTAKQVEAMGRGKIEDGKGMFYREMRITVFQKECK